MTESPAGGEAPEPGSLKPKLIRGGIVFGVLVVLLAGVLALVPGLSGIKSAITGASPGWIVAAFAIALVGVAGAVVFVQAVFDELPRRVTWWQGWGMQGANAVLPTAGSTGVSYWTVNSLGWTTYQFAERTAVMIIAPAAPNLVFIVVFGIGMGLGIFAGPSDWYLTWLPAVIAAIVIVVAVAAAIWAERIARRLKNKRLAQGLTILTTGVTGTVAILRRRSWRVLGTWIDLLGSIALLWASLIAVDDHLPFAVVTMGYLIGQFAQVIPVPGGLGTIDASVTGMLLVYGAPTTVTTAGELISHGISLLVPIAIGALAAFFLPREVAKARGVEATARTVRATPA